MRYNSLACYNPDQKVLRHFPFFMCLCMKFTANRQCTPINTALPRFLPQRRGGLTWIAFSLDERQSVPDVLTRIVVMNLKCTVAHSCHIKYKILTSKTSGQRSENENFFNFSRCLDPTAILFLHMVLSSGCFAATAEEMSTIATFVATPGKVS